MENATKKGLPKWLKITIGVVIFFVIIGIITGKSDDKTSTGNAATPPATESKKIIGLQEALTTDYFIVTVKNARIVDHLTENTDGYKNDLLKKEEGNKYIILDITLKNTDKESRMMFDGELLTSDGKKFEQAEPVMAEGYNIIMENINPGVTKTTKIVYKVPADLAGKIYYHPSRSSSNEMIEVLTL